MTDLIERTVLPGSDPREPGRLAELLTLLTENHEVSVVGGEQSAALSDPLRQILVDVLQHLSQGTAVTVEPHRTLLTTQEAADILGITRPTLVRLLKAGEIPYTTPGRHRRIELSHLLGYQSELRRRRAEALTALGNADPGATDSGFVITR